jgi:hypothetical protein
MIRYNARAPGRKERRGDTDSVFAYAALTDRVSSAGLHKRSIAGVVATLASVSASGPAAEAKRGWI